MNAAYWLVRLVDAAIILMIVVSTRLTSQYAAFNLDIHSILKYFYISITVYRNYEIGKIKHCAKYMFLAIPVALPLPFRQ